MLQVYTGSGKGKTTAAIGMAIRAMGAGLKVYVMQFMKSLAYSEQKVLQGRFPELTLRTSGKPFFIAEEGTLSKSIQDKLGDSVVIFPKGEPPQDYVDLIRSGFEEVVEAAVEYFTVRKPSIHERKPQIHVRKPLVKNSRFME